MILGNKCRALHSLSFSCSLFSPGGLDSTLEALGVGLLSERVMLARSEGVLQFEDAVGQRGVQVRVRHLFNTEAVQHLVVGRRLKALELLNADLAVVNGNEVDKLLVLVDVYVELLDRSRVGVDILLDGPLRLEETLKGRLTQGHLLQLGLLLALPLLCLRLQSLLVRATTHGGHHGLEVE